MSEKNELIEFETEGDSITLKLSGELVMTNADNYDLKQMPITKDTKKITLDMENVSRYDTFMLAFIYRVETVCKEKEIEFEMIGVDTDMQSYLDLLMPKDEAEPEKEEKGSKFVSKVENFGNKIKTNLTDIHGFVEYFGILTTKMLKLFVKPLSMRWEDFPSQVFRSGVMALPITMLIVFLIGLITGYQGATQLKRFGADMFIADLIGISITRELSPLMVAILVAGRSGSAFAAEIGSMKVTDEINAMTSMGYDKYEFLVLPRVLAVVLSMPFIVMICNVVGLFGGLIAAISTLDVTVISYVNRLEMSLTYGDIASGLIKSLFFGFVIASIGCYKGLKVEGGADSVGRMTTSSVVAAVFMIILSDAIFTFIFQAIGI
ncbi:MAG: ABC transporter permease [Candidatus Kapabacteria bacterium]|nr:ABC transporter permease [Candidatus Kapabacteria bacterium]